MLGDEQALQNCSTWVAVALSTQHCGTKMFHIIYSSDI